MGPAGPHCAYYHARLGYPIRYLTSAWLHLTPRRARADYSTMDLLCHSPLTPSGTIPSTLLKLMHTFLHLLGWGLPGL